MRIKAEKDIGVIGIDKIHGSSHTSPYLISLLLPIKNNLNY